VSIQWRKTYQYQGVKDEHDVVGVDLGIKTLATVSDGTKYENPKPLKTKLRKLKKRQQSRQPEGQRKQQQEESDQESSTTTSQDQQRPQGRAAQDDDDLSENQAGCRHRGLECVGHDEEQVSRPFHR
jgi:hypothetical protein